MILPRMSGWPRSTVVEGAPIRAAGSALADPLPCPVAVKSTPAPASRSAPATVSAAKVKLAQVTGPGPGTAPATSVDLLADALDYDWYNDPVPYRQALEQALAASLSARVAASVWGAEPQSFATLFHAFNAAQGAQQYSAAADLLSAAMKQNPTASPECGRPPTWGCSITITWVAPRRPPPSTAGRWRREDRPPRRWCPVHS